MDLRVVSRNFYLINKSIYYKRNYQWFLRSIYTDATINNIWEWYYGNRREMKILLGKKYVKHAKYTMDQWHVRGTSRWHLRSRIYFLSSKCVLMPRKHPSEQGSWKDYSIIELLLITSLVTGYTDSLFQKKARVCSVLLLISAFLAFKAN